jgi:hypothetical protein
MEPRRAFRFGVVCARGHSRHDWWEKARKAEQLGYATLDIIGFNQSLSSSAHRKQRAGDGKRREDCANHRQSPSPDPKGPRW